MSLDEIKKNAISVLAVYAAEGASEEYKADHRKLDDKAKTAVEKVFNDYGVATKDHGSMIQSLMTKAEPLSPAGDRALTPEEKRSVDEFRAVDNMAQKLFMSKHGAEIIGPALALPPDKRDDSISEALSRHGLSVKFTTDSYIDLPIGAEIHDRIIKSIEAAQTMTTGRAPDHPRNNEQERGK
jgi:hypothetical protein